MFLLKNALLSSVRISSVRSVFERRTLEEYPPIPRKGNSKIQENLTPVLYLTRVRHLFWRRVSYVYCLGAVLGVSVVKLSVFV